MLEDPGLDTRELAAALWTAWAVEASVFTFMPGYDMSAASYEVVTTDARAFLKVRFGLAADVSLEVPRALLDAGVRSVVAPTRTVANELCHTMGDGRTPCALPVRRLAERDGRRHDRRPMAELRLDAARGP